MRLKTLVINISELGKLSADIGTSVQYYSDINMNYSSNIFFRNPHDIAFSLFSSRNIFNIDNNIDCKILKGKNLTRYNKKVCFFQID